MLRVGPLSWIGLLLSATLMAACGGGSNGGTTGTGGTGAGGTKSTGGTTGVGGVTGSGGTTGTGGTTGSGGATVTGGTTGSGGAVGGAPGSGGTTGSGGASGQGGAAVTGGTSGQGGAAAGGAGGTVTAGTVVAALPANTSAPDSTAHWNILSTGYSALDDLTSGSPTRGCNYGPCFWVFGGMLNLWTYDRTSHETAFYSVPVTGGTFTPVLYLANNDSPDGALNLSSMHALNNMAVFVGRTVSSTGYQHRELDAVDMTSKTGMLRGLDSVSTGNNFQDLELMAGVSATGTDSSSTVYGSWYQFDGTYFNLYTFAINSGPSVATIINAGEGDVGFLGKSYAVDGGTSPSGGALRSISPDTLLEQYPFQILAAQAAPGVTGWAFVTPQGDVEYDPTTNTDGSTVVVTGQQAVGLYFDKTSIYFSAIVPGHSGRVVQRWTVATQATTTVLTPASALDTFGVFGDGYIYYTMSGQSAVYRAQLPP
jgi:hypothetical protein